MFIRLDYNIVNLIHILLIGSILILIGYLKKDTNKNIYYILSFLASLIIIFVPIPKLQLNYRNILYIFHYLVALPGFLAISYFGIKKNITPETYNAIGFLGIFIIIYHLFKLLKRSYNRFFYKKAELKI